MSNSATPWPVAWQAPVSSTVSQSLLKFVSIELVTLYNHLILCLSLILFPSIFPSIRVFSSESALLIRWPKYWSLRISPFSEYPGFISFEIDFTCSPYSPRDSQKSSPAPPFKSMNSQPSLWSSSPSIHDYWKTIALTIWIFVGKVMSLLFTTLSRFVIAFLPRSKCLLISWL